MSSVNGVGRTELDWYMVHFFLMKLDHQLTPYTRINSKWIKYLTVSHETTKMLEENIGSKISEIFHSNIFADMFPKAKKTKGKK